MSTNRKIEFHKNIAEEKNYICTFMTTHHVFMATDFPSPVGKGWE